MNKIYLTYLYIALGIITLLVLVTKGQPALVKRKVLIGLLILSISAPAVTLVSCSTGQQKEIWQTAGWVDGDTYRIIASGRHSQSAKTELQKKASARESAILSARYALIEMIKGSRIESCSGIKEYPDPAEVFIMELKPFILKDAVVVAERYNDEFICEIVYEFKYKDLKKRSLSLYN